MIAGDAASLRLGVVMNDNTLPADPRLADTMVPAKPKEGGSASSTGAFLRASVLPPSGALAAPSADAAARFRSLQPLGVGGIGEVVLVEDRDIDRRVAIKRLRPEQRSVPALARFAEEVRIIGQLEHPNITPVHDVGVDDHGQHYFVMKYVEGQTMEAIIKQLRAGDAETARRFSPEHRVEVFIGVLNAVHYAHSRGVIHRDIKPSNIMIGPFGEVTLMDWGIAKRTGGGDGVDDARAGSDGGGDPRLRTHAGAVVGTPLYMAPEQAAGDNERVDQRADIYSLSLTFLEWMTLRHPLADVARIDDVLAAQRRGAIEPRAVRQAFEGVAPVEYGNAIARGLDPDPARRFQSVAEMLDELRRLQAGEIPVRCHITFTKRATRELVHFADRRPGLYTMLFFAVLLGVVAGLGALAVHLVRLL